MSDSTQEQTNQDSLSIEGADNLSIFTPTAWNTDEMLKWSKLTPSELWDKMRELGKIVTFRGWYSPDSPVTLIGFTEEDVSNAYYYKLTVRDLLVAIEEVYTGRELPYEHEKGETFHKYWLLDENKQRTGCVSISARDGRDAPRLLGDYKYGGGLSQRIIHRGDTKKISAWVNALKVVQTEIDHKLIFRAANIVEEEELAAARKLSSTGDTSAREYTSPDVDPTAIGIRAKKLGVRPSRLERWDRIYFEFYSKGRTQAQIAEIESVSPETIKKDFKDMRKKDFLPSAKMFTP